MKAPRSHVHQMTEENTIWVIGPKGKRYARCRICLNNSNKLRYRNNEAHREKVKADNLERYYRKGNNHVG